MSELLITVLKVACDTVTDALAEGSTDEFGWRLVLANASGERSRTLEEIPMRRMEVVRPGSEYTLNRTIGPLGPEWRTAHLEFWDRDSFSSDDLLGRIDIRRDGEGKFSVAAADSAQDLGDGRFRLTGEGGKYRVWLSFEET